MGKGLLIFLLVCAALAFIKAMGDGNKTAAPATTQDISQRVVPEEKAVGVSALKLSMDYQSNEVAADNAYKGHRLAVQGVITSISKDMFDKIYLSLATPNEFMNVQAHLAEGSAAQAASLQRGQVITVICTGNGMIVGSPMLKDCSFARSELPAPAKAVEPPAPVQEIEQPATSDVPANKPSDTEGDQPPQ